MGVIRTVLNVFCENRKQKNSAWLITSLRASEIAQWVGVNDPMPDDLGSFPRIHIVGGEKQPPQVGL